MQHHETELEMAHRHVAEGRMLVERQRRVLAELRDDEHPTAAAEQVLAELEHSQSLFAEHLDRLTGGGSG